VTVMIRHKRLKSDGFLRERECSARVPGSCHEKLIYNRIKMKDI
jgi:hypothetical protein